MPALPISSPSASEQSFQLAKRYWGDYSSGGAKYAFFAFLAIVVVFFFIFTCMVNVRRIKSGSKPLISSYLAPPAYYQVQQQNSLAQQLPTYTAQPNPNQDIGYYDQTGTFIPYNKPQTETDTELNNLHGQSYYQPQQSQSGNPFDFQATGYQQTTTIPPAAATTTTTSTTAEYTSPTSHITSSQAENDLPGYTPPAGPPPGHLR
ncbi:hypothetical protein CANARDRAFT_58053 [[Candida] arabinofermentans NRRL YB-2248]|uniref:Uncharacterized protein n=1 Tax=[Candida] arabinofermentans NRRL YB-2248 TaxID=983967 RepID=A0A1E4T8T3_9ASCO|nr:hypothetical protein CANARDRAFT_58053 [[Candida] arabinofermentans NRRL YB-2248]